MRAQRVKLQALQRGKIFGLTAFTLWRKVSAETKHMQNLVAENIRCYNLAEWFSTLRFKHRQYEHKV